MKKTIEINHPTELLNLAEREKLVYEIKVDGRRINKLLIKDNILDIEYFGDHYFCFLSPGIICQIGSRIWKNRNCKEIISFWRDSIGSNPNNDALSKIKNVFLENELIIRFFEAGGIGFEIYGIVTENFVQIDQLDFRENFIKNLNKCGFNNPDSGNVFLDKYKNVREIFNFSIPNSRFSISLNVKYGLNNGFSGFNFDWKRLILICTNGLGKVESQIHNSLKHYGETDIEMFTYQILSEAQKLMSFTEKSIFSAENRPLSATNYNLLNQKLRIASATKEKIQHKLKSEIDICGKNDWALSQAFTYIGTHDKHTADFTKRQLIYIGTKILETSLEQFISNDNNYLPVYEKECVLLG